MYLTILLRLCSLSVCNEVLITKRNKAKIRGLPYQNYLFSVLIAVYNSKLHISKSINNKNGIYINWKLILSKIYTDTIQVWKYVKALL